MIRAALVALMLLPASLLAQRDSTVCVAFRTRTAATGAILTTSVMKVPCSAPAIVRYDTVTIRLPAPPPIVRVDTVALNGWWRPNYRPSFVNIGGTTIVFGIVLTSGTKPPNIEIPPPGGTTIVRVDTVTIRVPVPGPIQYVRDTVTLPAPPAPPCPICTTLPPPPPTGALTTRDRSPYLTDVFASGVHLGYVGASGVTWTAWRRLSFTPDSIAMDRVSYPSQAVAIDALTKPYTGPITPAAILPELPRVYLDTRMPPTPGSIITVPP